jgi:tRNA(fMet)-specific endonuclease VapC
VVYLLDTSTCSYALMGHPTVFARLDSLDRDSWLISSLVLAELQFGLEKNQLRPRSRESLALFLKAAPIASFDSNAAREAAMVRAELEARGTPSGAVDQLIAGHARALGAILVTSNTKHFEGVHGLRVEDWASNV